MSCKVGSNTCSATARVRALKRARREYVEFCLRLYRRLERAAKVRR